MTYVTKYGAKRQTISVRLDPGTIQELDDLVAAGHVDNIDDRTYWHVQANRSAAIRRAIRDAHKTRRPKKSAASRSATARARRDKKS